MKELVVISGKGGTGKTSLMGAFASMAENMVLCDADVDAADLHLIIDPDIKERHEFQSGYTASIISEKCTNCGLCRDLCRFDAISENYVIDSIACEGCGVCHYFCPEEAVDFSLNTCGEWYLSESRFGPVVHARLGIAEENSGKLVSLVRQEGKKIAEKRALSLILTDGPPGVGCPVIASLGGANSVIIVAEPTVSGMHDMERVVQLADFFKVPAMLCVNKFDLNSDKAVEIEQFAREKNVASVGRIPFDPTFTKAMVEGKTILEYSSDSAASDAVKKIWEKIVEEMGL